MYISLLLPLSSQTSVLFGFLCCNGRLDLKAESSVVWQESGLASWIGGHLQPLAEVPPAAAVMLITAFLACFTEFASNTATIIIFLPVIAELVRIGFLHSTTQGFDSMMSCRF